MELILLIQKLNTIVLLEEVLEEENLILHRQELMMMLEIKFKLLIKILINYAKKFYG
jgi:hypothetical protein